MESCQLHQSFSDGDVAIHEPPTYFVSLTLTRFEQSKTVLDYEGKHDLRQVIRFIQTASDITYKLSRVPQENERKTRDTK